MNPFSHDPCLISPNPILFMFNIENISIDTGLHPSSYICDIGAFFHALHHRKFIISSEMTTFQNDVSVSFNASHRDLGFFRSEFSLVVKHKTSGLQSNAR